MPSSRSISRRLPRERRKLSSNASCSRLRRPKRPTLKSPSRVVPQLRQWRRVTASSLEQTGQVEMTSWGMAVVLAPDGPNAPRRRQATRGGETDVLGGWRGGRAAGGVRRLEDPALAKVGFEVALVLGGDEVGEGQFVHDRNSIDVSCGCWPCYSNLTFTLSSPSVTL